MIFIRPAGLADVEGIGEIERSATSAWSETQIASELQHSRGISLIAAQGPDSPAVGWCCSRIVAPEAELLKITVLPQYRRSGVGSSLFAALADRLHQANCTDIFLEVRRSNTSARSFYQRKGFFELARRKMYYDDPPEDCIILKKSRQLSIYENKRSESL